MQDGERVNLAEIRLHITADGRPELYALGFSHRELESPVELERGKTAGAYGDVESFQWTRAVRALTVLLLRSKAELLRRPQTHRLPILEGDKGSLAISLEYALGKHTSWLQDLFGVDRRGRPLTRKLFRRSNPKQKHAGPVAVSLNRAAWEPISIRVIMNLQEISSSAEIETLAAAIESSDACSDSFRQAPPDEGTRAAPPVDDWKERYRTALSDNLQERLSERTIFINPNLNENPNPNLKPKPSTINPNQTFLHLRDTLRLSALCSVEV